MILKGEKNEIGWCNQGWTVVGFNFIMCQCYFISSRCLSFCRLLTGPTSMVLLLGTLSQQTKKPLWNSLFIVLITIPSLWMITRGLLQPCRHKMYKLLWELFPHFFHRVPMVHITADIKWILGLRNYKNNWIKVLFFIIIIIWHCFFFVGAYQEEAK